MSNCCKVRLAKSAAKARVKANDARSTLLEGVDERERLLFRRNAILPLISKPTKSGNILMHVDDN